MPGALQSQCNCSWRRSANRLPNWPVERCGQFCRRRSFPTLMVKGIDDLSTGAVLQGWRFRRAAHASLRAQMVHRALFSAPRLNEQAAVNRLVGHTHALVVGIVDLQPPGNLLGRPVQNQFARNIVLSTSRAGQEGTAWAARLSPRRGHPPHGRDRWDGHRGEKAPGSPSRPLDPVVEQSSRKRRTGSNPS